MLFILTENNAYFDSIIKQKFFNLFFTLIFSFIVFITLKNIIHKYNIFNNSNYTKLANELAQKIPTKDRIVNALQIYSKIDFNNKYSDLTINAVNQLENELKNIKISKIKFEIYRYNIYILLILMFIFLSFLNIKNYKNSIHRLVNKNVNFEREVPFSLNFVNSKIR